MGLRSEENRVPGAWGTGWVPLYRGRPRTAALMSHTADRKEGTWPRIGGKAHLGCSGLTFLENGGSLYSWRRGLEGSEGVGTDRGHMKGES